MTSSQTRCWSTHAPQRVASIDAPWTHILQRTPLSQIPVRNNPRHDGARPAKRDIHGEALGAKLCSKSPRQLGRSAASQKPRPHQHVRSDSGTLQKVHRRVDGERPEAKEEGRARFRPEIGAQSSELDENWCRGRDFCRESQCSEPWANPGRPKSGSSNRAAPVAPMFVRICGLFADVGAKSRATLSTEFGPVLGDAPIDLPPKWWPRADRLQAPNPHKHPDVAA